LRAHGVEPRTRDAVRAAVVAGDEAAPPQLLKDGEAAIVEPPTIAVKAIDGQDFARVAAARLDTAALRERVQRALLVFGNVKGRSPDLNRITGAQPRMIAEGSGARGVA